MMKRGEFGAMDPSIYEKLGAFYLGRPYDLANKQGIDQPLLYDSKDLLTHAVCVGMTGSGKTGLCVGLLEEASLDGIPALVIDPKGDLGNLLLTFPNLEAGDFRPWVNEDDARRAGKSLDEYATQEADLWRGGLAKWGQDGDRIRRLREAADFVIYTPGSESGLPVSVLGSFAAPAAAVLEDGDLFRERISTSVSSLLALLAIDADPIQSREHILLSTILEQRWSSGSDVDLATLIRDIQSPPAKKIGVMPVDDFFPANQRAALALRLNNLLASPGFQGWLHGQPLDIGEILYTDSGRPRVAIFSIAHLSDSERMFFVSLLLNELVSWMRTRPGTTSLRALLYMDEIFGFMPPVAEPPSKKPLLTLMKQARAFGVGVVLATQNPVDLDYKGLSNAGTWLIGRLQTERDKMRMLEGLEGVDSSASFDRQELDSIISSLGKRVFLLHNVHEGSPRIFETRWVMSYLRGPLTRSQIHRLMAVEKDKAEASAAAAEEETQPVGATPKPSEISGAETRPIVAGGVDELFHAGEGSTAESLVLRPYLYGQARVLFVDRKSKAELARREVRLVSPLTAEDADVDWSAARQLEIPDEQLERVPPAARRWLPLPPAACKEKSYRTWEKELGDTLYRETGLELFESPSFKVRSEPDESEKDFRIRLADLARERRDAEVEKLRQRHEKKAATLEDRIRKARARVEKEQQQASSQRLQTAISVGSAVLSMLTGRKGVSRTDMGRAASAVRGFGRSAEQSGDVERARDTVESLVEQLETLNEELEAEIDQVGERFDAQAEELSSVVVRPRKSDIEVRQASLLWLSA